MKQASFWATAKGATKYGDNPIRPMYAAVYKSGGRGTPSLYFGVALYMTSKAFVTFGSPKLRRNLMS